MQFIAGAWVEIPVLKEHKKRGASFPACVRTACRMGHTMSLIAVNFIPQHRQLAERFCHTEPQLVEGFKR